MKKTIITLAIALAFIAATATSFADVKEVKIQTSAVCDMCKNRIEKSINQLDGIINANLNLDDKTVTVKYDDKTAKVERIKKAISMAGYKADDMAADPKAYKMLPDHCKGVAVIKTQATSGCGATCKDKTTEAKAACCPKGCASTVKVETYKPGEIKTCCPSGTVKGDAKGCCPSGTVKTDAKSGCPSSTSTVKIDGSAKLQSKCAPGGCSATCQPVKPADLKK